MPKHTRGPWYVGAMNDALFIINQQPSPSGSDAPVDTPHFGLKVIAKVESGMGFEVDKANADLLAAAPDLLSACRVVTAYLDNLENGCDEADPLTIARRTFHAPLRAALNPAIAKAEGRES